jgi:hypothetical protein
MLWIYAGTKQAIESKRKAFIRKWRLQCRAVASIVRGAPPSVLELVKLEAENLSGRFPHGEAIALINSTRLRPLSFP